jgi:hypothetical protein
MIDRLRWKLLACFFVVAGWSLFDFPRSHNLESFAFQDPGFNFTSDSLVERGYRPNLDFGYAYGPLLLILDRAWFALAGQTPNSYWLAILVCNLGMATALACAARSLKADASGWLLLLLTLPMFRGFAILVYGVEPLLITWAIAEHARGRRPTALALLTVCLFVKPTMGYVYGLLLVVAILRDAWHARHSGFRVWWRPFVPAAAAGLACLGVTVWRFGARSVMNCFLFPFTEGPAHYRINHFGFFRGLGGREMLLPEGARYTYYIGSFAGFWVVASVVLLAFTVAAMVRPPAADDRSERNTTGEVLICCGIMHVAFVTLFFAHAWSWQYYFFILIVGLVAAKGRTASASRWLLTLAVILPLAFQARSALQYWRTLSPRQGTRGLWATDAIAADWKKVLELTTGTRAAVLSPIGGMELLAPSHFVAPTNLTLYRHYTLPVEIDRKIAEIRAADIVVVHDSDPKGRRFLDEWHEFDDALAHFERVWEAPALHVYKRRQGDQP